MSPATQPNTIRYDRFLRSIVSYLVKSEPSSRTRIRPSMESITFESCEGNVEWRSKEWRSFSCTERILGVRAVKRHQSHARVKGGVRRSSGQWLVPLPGCDEMGEHFVCNNGPQTSEPKSQRMNGNLPIWLAGIQQVDR